MAKEICISSTPHETRLAILEDDQLAEIYYERENEYTLAGSIYNGRVTRVLPGMQSAFVDVGLERDAFLYVTDFMELEDSEETDELEKAAATGANQAPREVRHTNGSQRQEPQQARAPRDRRPTGLIVQDADAVQDAPGISGPESASEATSDPPAGAEDGTGSSGGRRWRGRRNRRGGRGPSAGAEGRVEAEEPSETLLSATPDDEIAPIIQAGAMRQSHAQPPAQPAGAVPFVLPGESLSKYGGTPSDDAPKAARETAPARPASSFKPATMIESPIVWDGSGLLPGESLSRHRIPEPEPVEAIGGEEPTAAPDRMEEHELLAENPEAEAVSAAEDHLVEGEQEFEETSESAPEPLADSKSDVVAVSSLAPQVEETVDEEFVEEETPAAEALLHEEALEETELEEQTSEASASHKVDPAPHTGFRLFGFGKKKEEEPAKAKATSVPAVSSYKPGSGHIEEEIIEGEEMDALPHRAHRHDEHDLDDLEEETLPTGIRRGDLGELLQEAHLDHRIQMNFDEKGGEEGFDDEDDEVTATADQPAAGDASAQQRRDRGGRGRRGRAPQGAAGHAAGQINRRGGPSRRSMQTSDLPIISDLLKPGQEILVQIAKEPIAKKGARITSHIALPGRFLVFMPTVTHIGVSRKIASDEERHRLKRILMHERGDAPGGFIVRTAGEGASEEELRADLRFLMNLWNDIKQRSDSSKSPALIYHDLSLIERILRDQVSSNFANIWVDTEADYERIVRFLNRFSPTLVRRVKLYTKELPLFEHFGVQDEISKALRSKVWLKSGGSIVINQTEALVAIDINTGKYVGKSARLEDTIVKTNLDAVPEIVRQIRLRDLGGIIVIDFIDMDERKNRYKVLAALEEALKADRAPTKVLQFNDFGLVAITRKRVKQSLERTLSVPCATCQATGMVKSPTTVCNEIYIELRKMKKHFEGADVLVRVHPETVKVLKQNNASWLVEFEELTGKNILVKSDPTLHPEQFDLQG
jgi:ribonuclease G